MVNTDSLHFDTGSCYAIQRTTKDNTGYISENVDSYLRTLEEDGLVKRQIYAQVPPKVEYSLTKRAMSLLPHINSLISWAQENMEDIINDRKKHKSE